MKHGIKTPCYQSPQSRHDLFRLGVVAKRLADVDEEIDIPRTEDKATAELERIFAQTMLSVPAGHGTFARPHVVGPRHVQHRALLEADRAVSAPLVVNQQRESDAGFFFEPPRVMRVAEPDRGNPGPGFCDLLLVVAQLRDVLAAEDSPVVAEEDQHGGALLPQRAEPDFVTFGVR